MARIVKVVGVIVGVAVGAWAFFFITAKPTTKDQAQAIAANEVRLFVTSCAVCECSLTRICPSAVSCGSAHPEAAQTFVRVPNCVPCCSDRIWSSKSSN
jgi:hypothetical protein